MKPALLLVSAIALAPFALPAQQNLSSTPGDGYTSFESVTGPNGLQSHVYVYTAAPCPVSLQAKHGSGGALVMVRRPQGEAPGHEPSLLNPRPTGHIHLLLGSITGEKQVTSVTITARGFSNRGYIDRTSSSNAPDIRLTLDAAVSAETDGTLYADLALPGFTTVRSIKLESIHYADGSVWNLSAQGGCTVAPDPLMLVADR